MSPEIEALARRAVACVEISRWPDWTPVLITRCEPEIRGALITNGPIRYVIDEEGSGWFFDGSGCGNPGAIPLLDTPAGLGSLLAVMREAWDRPLYAGERLHQDGDFDPDLAFVFVTWLDGDKLHSFNAPSFAELLVSALEAAP